MSTDFQLAPTTGADPTPPPTGSAEPTAVPAPTTIRKNTTPTLDHTPGGLPVIPLAVITSNTTVAGLSALAVTAGPVAAAAAAGSVLVGAVAVKAAGARAARKPNRPRTVQKPAPRTPQNSSGGTRRNLVPTQRSAGSGNGGKRRTTPSASTSAGTRSRTNGASRSTTGAAKTSLTKKNTPAKPTSPSGKNHARKTPQPPSSRAEQIKALRRDKAAAAPTRKERRAKELADRRVLRDGRRQAKRDARAQKKSGGPGASTTAPHTKAPRPGNNKHNGKGGTSPSLTKRQAVTQPVNPKTSGKASDTLRPVTKTDTLRAKTRAAIDKASENRTARIRQARHKAKARAALVKARTRARTRFATRAAGAGLLAAPLGLLGCLTTPIGKRLGWRWLQHPGRRLYRRLTETARYNRNARLADAQNTYAHDTDPASLEIAPDQQSINDTVARAPRTGHTPDLTGDPDMSEDIKLHFLETSEETVSAARAYEPGGMLHVRQVIKAMPVALENWAQAFAVLAEKSDAEFPLGDEIGEGLDDIHQQMRQLISHAEELAQTFDRIHENDIERLINPRKSREAEKTWDTTANEDYDAD